MQRAIAAVVAGMWLLLMAGGATLAAGPPFPDRPADTHIVDNAGVFNRLPEEGVEEGLRALLDSRAVDVVVYTQVKAAARDQTAVDADAQALLDQWAVGGSDGQGAVLMFDFDRPDLARAGIPGPQRRSRCDRRRRRHPDPGRDVHG